MPFLQANNISHQFSNGDVIFENLSCVMTHSRVGLIGSNGAGKSLLASILLKLAAPYKGTVSEPKDFVFYQQQTDQAFQDIETIVEFLGVSKVLDALKKIASGDCDPYWFDVVGDSWSLEQQLKDDLLQLGLPQEPEFRCEKLSGGQRAKLLLWKAFDSECELLVLDEPSNHLDRESKQWLMDAMQRFEGGILLISHDRELLRNMNEIWELSTLGLRTFGGNYDDYTAQSEAEKKAVERQLNHNLKQQKLLEKQAQRNRDKAEQRAAQGAKQRKSGSQPKILMDAKKGKATANMANRLKNESVRRTHLDDKAQQLEARYARSKPQSLYLGQSDVRSKRVLSVIQGKLPFSEHEPITFQLYSNSKLYLEGKNGIGKSTLLNVLRGYQTLVDGELQVSAPVCYLDQHFGAIERSLSMLDNLTKACPHLNESEARTLLAGIGFRRNSVNRIAQVLSGGEKMKLAMLMVSHQFNQPILLLDEPDNHLDIESKVMLAKALMQYQGGYILVSHDQDFVHESGVNQSLRLSAPQSL
ncbi:ATP-binding cassette domain-containing protein [Vibrio sp. D404a]|uniref:ATP-binding cassette domain-containing protein n=1 Tax=unclassified Vibrio TaxID=2614977 RepID=UPI002556B923|nr:MULTISPECIES: ATP-binding cassette domain-containing protein [unclassified Vibrio]MDK9736827.1 ATP-binding cassette domain-containing protein [Vibrio sp. D404a]MDK9795755.1 ATP-binding cassette domain-containing protein [Vibrio sp. D449a]